MLCFQAKTTHYQRDTQSLNLIHFIQLKEGRQLYERRLWASGLRRQIYEVITAKDEPLSPHSKKEQGLRSGLSINIGGGQDL